MKDEQYMSFKKLIDEVSTKTFNKVMDMEIKAQPDKEDFFNGVRGSDFFRHLFERGMIEGINYSRSNMPKDLHKLRSKK